MRIGLNTLNICGSGLLLACGLFAVSCGSAQNAGDEILRLGGISSTGNKDEDNGTATTDSKQEQPQSMPIPGDAALVCEHPVDLSGRVYEFLAQAQSQLKSCGEDERAVECVEQLAFSTKEDLTIRYRLSEDRAVNVTATYRMCETSLGIWTVDAQGASQIDSFKSAEDVSILTHIRSGHAFQLIP